MNLGPFARLFGLQRSEHARARLLELRQKHSLTDNDPVWDLVAAVEEFCADLKAEAADAVATTPPSPTSSTPSSMAKPTDWWRIGALCGAGAAFQSVLLAIAFAIGVSSAHQAPANLLIAALTMPVGWVAFVLTLPLLAAIAGLGWRARRTEPAIGWTLAIVGSASSLSAFAALWRLL